MSIKEYCLVENGAISAGPTNLPPSWRNVSGINLLSDAALLSYGWRPVVDVLAPLAPWHKHGTPELVVNGSNVLRRFGAVALPDEKIIATIRDDVQAWLDGTAKDVGYDDIKSAVSYADEPSVPQFQAEGRAFRAWRSLVWEAGNQILAEVLSGARPKPASSAALIAELPQLQLPTEQGGV